MALWLGVLGLALAIVLIGGCSVAAEGAKGSLVGLGLAGLLLALRGLRGATISLRDHHDAATRTMIAAWPRTIQPALWAIEHESGRMLLCESHRALIDAKDEEQWPLGRPLDLAPAGSQCSGCLSEFYGAKL